MTSKENDDPQGQARMFISLDPPPVAREEAAAWGREVARTTQGLRPIPPGSIHLTLAFLGTRPLAEVDLLAEAIDHALREVGEIQGGAPLWLPKRRPRALALEVREASGRLEELRSGLVQRLGTLAGWQPERRGFLPHLTVGRAGRGFRPGRAGLPPTPSLGFLPEAITLYRSHLDSEGARYESLYTAPLR
ncbi:MAG: RNA 2',3'-cyclic phosphodiesterase [Solirubrobacterales bacterium]|nr:RNA 2',3'-cyclic phosphodiesterase [Solirubrobacterales bacterium]